ncbi:MAG: hypothetical protein J7493_15385 [Porphyrobacter sp.]|nr:hypothetical protein [Porphyrobacter sp.]
MLERRSIKIGDVFQILTSQGVCYGQVTHSHARWGWIVAIFREFFDEEPVDFKDVVKKEPQFVTAFLIEHAVKEGLFSLVANVPVPASIAKFPIFRGTNNLKGEETMWFFWDGEKEWKVQRPLTNEEKRYPEGPSLPSAPVLIERIERDYRVYRDYV